MQTRNKKKAAEKLSKFSKLLDENTAAKGLEKLFQNLWKTRKLCSKSNRLETEEKLLVTISDQKIKRKGRPSTKKKVEDNEVLDDNNKYSSDSKKTMKSQAKSTAEIDIHPCGELVLDGVENITSKRINPINNTMNELSSTQKTTNNGKLTQKESFSRACLTHAFIACFIKQDKQRVIYKEFNRKMKPNLSKNLMLGKQ